MASTIQLTNASSNLVDYLADWAAGFSTTYGAFYSPNEGLVTSPTEIAQNPQYEYSQWGNGATGGNGVVLNGDFQYSQGNLTGSTTTLEFGTGYSQTGTGIDLSNTTLTIDTDPGFNNASGSDALDLAIYQLTRFGSLSGIYNYLAATGTVIEDTTGSNVLTGFGGTDTFVLSGGNDSIEAGGTGTYGFQDGSDKLDVTGWGATAFNQLSVFASGSDTIVFYGAHSVTLAGVGASAVDASDFLF